MFATENARPNSNNTPEPSTQAPGINLDRLNTPGDEQQLENTDVYVHGVLTQHPPAPFLEGKQTLDPALETSRDDIGVNGTPDITEHEAAIKVEAKPTSLSYSNS